MMKTKAVFSIVLLLLLLIVPVCRGQELGFLDGIEARSYCEAVIDHVAKDQIKEAFVLIGAQWPFPVVELKEVQEQAEKNQVFVEERFGQPCGYRLVKEEVVSEVCLRYTYVIKYEKHLVRWQFVFYKAKDRWQLNSFKWDDAIEALFGQ
jgi:hypothetical protein